MKKERDSFLARWKKIKTLIKKIKIQVPVEKI